ncbi:MAG TPA: hypothetical protein VF897_15140, partial [Roseiflexaceae bacterium]
MSDPEERQPAEPAPDAPALGRSGAGPRDSQLDAGPPTAPASHRRAPRSVQGEPAPAEDRLELPAGALVALRKSGGLKFSSREVVVYRDGRVTYQAIPPEEPEAARAPRKLTRAQLADLRGLIGQI